MTPRERIEEAVQRYGDKMRYGEAAIVPQGGKTWAEEATDNIIDIMLDVIGPDDRDYSRDNADPESLAFLVGASTACNELRQQFRDSLTREKE